MESSNLDDRRRAKRRANIATTVEWYETKFKAWLRALSQATRLEPAALLLASVPDADAPDGPSHLVVNSTVDTETAARLMVNLLEQMHAEGTILDPLEIIRRSREPEPAPEPAKYAGARPVH